MRPTVLFAAIGFAALFAMPALAEVSRGELMASSCFTCHGPGGRGADSMPPIRGLGEERLLELLEDFKAGERDPTIMDRHAKGYTDEELRELAGYLGELE